MRMRTLAGAAAISGLFALSVPAAEAAHRHSRSCGHDRGYSSRSYRAPRYSSGHRAKSYRSYRSYRPSRSYSYRPYRYTPYRYTPYRYAYDPYPYRAYAYDPYYDDGYYPPVRRGHYHRGLFCVRPHLSIRIGF
jgi:hypothetical protein